MKKYGQDISCPYSNLHANYLNDNLNIKLCLDSLLILPTGNKIFLWQIVHHIPKIFRLQFAHYPITF